MAGLSAEVGQDPEPAQAVPATISTQRGLADLHHGVLLTHARVLLDTSPQVIVADGDLTDPQAILGNAPSRTHLDFTRPVAILLEEASAGVIPRTRAEVTRSVDGLELASRGSWTSRPGIPRSRQAARPGTGRWPTYFCGGVARRPDSGLAHDGGKSQRLR